MDVDCDNWRSKLSYTRRKWHVKEDVVISGMSGRFPKSENIQEFTQNLFNGVDMVSSSEDRYPAGKYGFPLNCGKVQNLSKFDADFFKIPEKDAHYMDPQLRKVLEVSFEAVVDAGIEVETLNGSNTGFYYGSCFHETDMAFEEDPLRMPRYQQNYTTLVSKALGLKGPIGQFDTACASSLSALNEAFTALKSGICDRALVASFNICLVPGISHQFKNLSMASTSGKCRSMDKSADGYGRGEAVCCVVLQLKSEAKRIYSTVVNCRISTDGYKDQGITFPSMMSQRQLIAETWDEVDLDPSQIDYIEAHVTGTQVGDPVELKSIVDVFCDRRSPDNPLKIGCIKSNMGHSEAAAGLCAVIKANIIFQSGYIPPNLHFNTPNPRIEGLMNGKVVPVCKITPLNGKYIPANSFGFGGANAHVILRGHKVTSTTESYQIANHIPRLVLVCNRTREGIDSILRFLKDKQCSLTREFFDLFNQYSKTHNMPYKDYVLISDHNKVIFHHGSGKISQESSINTVTIILPAQKIKFDPLFVHFSVFSRTLDRLAKYTKPLGIDLSRLLFNTNESISVGEEIVATVASQIILINLFRALNVSINRFIGPSTGRLAYGVAKNLLPEGRAIAAAYTLGYLIDHENLSNGQICALNFAVNQSLNTDLVENFGEKISTAGDFYDISNEAFVKRVDHVLMNFAKETKTNTGKKLMTFLDHQIVDSKQSDYYKLSSKIERKSTIECIDQKLYGQAIDSLPSNTILINFNTSDVSKYSNSRRNVQFMESTSLDMNKFLHSIGQLYTLDLPIDISCLYPKVNYPVPINTLSLHSLIDFDHSKEYSVFKYPEYFNEFAFRSYFISKVSLSNAEDWFYSDHKIDGRIIFPATGMLMFAWKTAAKFHKICMKRSKFIFRDVSFIRTTVLMGKEAQFKICYMPHNGSFIISESEVQIVIGKIFVMKNIDEAKSNYYMIESQVKGSQISIANKCMELSTQEIYKELTNRGYDYGPSFRCLAMADQWGQKGKIEWKDASIDRNKTSIFGLDYDPELITWITFADSLMQLSLLSNRFNRGLFLPISIETMLIDAEQIFSKVNTQKEMNYRRECGKIEKNLVPEKGTEENRENTSDMRILFDAVHDPVTKTLACEGLWIRGLKASLAVRKPQKVLVESQEFIPFEEENIMELDHQKYLQNYVHICDKHIAHIRSKETTKLCQLTREFEEFKQDISFVDKFSIDLLECLIDFQVQKKFDSSKIDQDILIGRELQLSSHYRFLQPFLATALDTKSYCGQLNSSFSVIEYNNSRTLYLDMIKSTINTLSIGTIEIAYTVACSKPEPEKSEAVSGKASLISWNADSPLTGDVFQADLLVYKNYSENISSLRSRIQHLIQAIGPDGFLLIVFRESICEMVENICSIPQLHNIITNLKACCMKSEEVIGLMDEMDWICVSNRLLESKLLPIRGLLFRKKPDTIIQPEIVLISPFKFEWIEKLKEAFGRDDKKVPIWLVGDPRKDQSVVGFTKSLSMEANGDRVICIANRYHDQGPDLMNFDPHDLHFKQILLKRFKFNIYDPEHGWGQYTCLKFDEKREKKLESSIRGSRNLELKILQPGDLSSLKWCESSITKHSISSINVCYASLNFKDVLLASARLPQVFEPSTIQFKTGDMSTEIGLEYAGYDEDGQPVMGMVVARAMATKCERSSANFDWPVPIDWSLEDAATVPVVYGTAIYGLIMRGNLKRGESVLIHSGSGGVGIAAIHLCLSYDCTVYTTVGTAEKRRFILERFPQLTEANIGNSRDTSFEEMILRETDGRGVDIVLNSLIGDKLQASIRCLAPGGRLIEIGKYDGIRNNPIDLEGLRIGQSFHGVTIGGLLDDSGENKHATKNERQRLRELYEILLEKKVIKPLPRTVFTMDCAEDAFRYMAAGKHIGKVVIKIKDPENPNSVSLSSAIKTVEFYPNKAYIIIGGFGGFGLEVALWMAFNGAKHIVINSRSGPKTSYHQYCIDRMVENNVQVVISKHDLTTESGVCELFTSLTAPIGGIFNSTLVMNDALFMDQTGETFAKVCASKVNITYNMDKISREMCPSLDYFVVFSSVASGRGNIGQTNYSLANSYMESVCERRRRDGLHGLAIQWGFIGDVGFVVEKFGNEVNSIRGAAPQRLHSCLAILNRTLGCLKSIISSMVMSEDKKLSTGSSTDIFESISHILGITNFPTSDQDITLGELGMDSLMAIEVQQTLERNSEISMTTKEIRQLKIKDLVKLSKQLKSSNHNTNDRSTLTSNRKLNSTVDETPVLPDSHITKLNDNVGEIVFVLPPIEGQFHQLIDVIKPLEQSVIGLNWTYDLVQLKSFDEVVRTYVDRIIEVTSDPENGSSGIKIKMIGYSFGGIIALAIAKHFEKFNHGPKVAKLALLDADLEYVKNMISKTVSSITRSESEDFQERELIMGFMRRYLTDISELGEILNKAISKADRFDVAKKFMIQRGIDASVAESLSKMHELIGQKIHLIRNHRSEAPSDCQIIHFRAKESFPSKKYAEKSIPSA
ncbi:fatty acid synthase-like [Brevipalpus obovatus]|uniref:fatty acid synthase-like n=1 Tax=Brevipalpus obovatus TaxID=246614 RepID=UPI003D9E5A42